MAKIVLTRIDDRLIHGQVMTAWVKNVRSNRIAVVDDETAKDEFMKSVLSMSVSSGITLGIYTVEEGMQKLSDLSHYAEKDRIIILAKGPMVLKKLIDGGVEIKKIIIGGMGANRERKVLFKNISATEEEKRTLKELKEMGIKTSIHIIPDQKEVQLDKLL